MVNIALKLSSKQGNPAGYLFGETGLPWPTLIWYTKAQIALQDLVMVPVAAGGPTKPTTSYQSMQSQLVAKPSTVSVPKSKTVPGTGISIIKDEK